MVISLIPTILTITTNYFFKYLFGVPHLASFIHIIFIEYVIANIVYIHAVYGGIRSHDLLDLLP